MRIAVALPAIAVAFAVAAAGCGSTETSAPTARATEAAKLVPADATAFVSVDTDLDSPQWQKVKALAERFPGRDDLVEFVLKELGQEGLDWARDIEPALGPQTVVAVRPGSDEPVVLTQPDDRGKLDALAAKADPPLVADEFDGDWVAVAKSKAVIDDFSNAVARGSLADDDEFVDALGGLPEDTVATLFVRGSGLLSLPTRIAPASQTSDQTSFFKWLAAGVEATGDGLHIVGSVSSSREVVSYEPALLERIPDRVALAISFNGLGDLLAQLRSDEQLKGFLPMIEQGLGIDLDDLQSLLEGEGALYVRPGLPIPEVTLALTTDSEAEAMASADRIMTAVGRLASGKLDTTGGTHTLSIQGFPISWTAFDGTLVLTSGANGVADFRADGDKLPDDPDFARAADRAGLGDETSGFAYVDMQQAVPLLDGIASLAGEELPAALRENLEPLDTLLVRSNADGKRTRFEGFLSVRAR